MTDDRARLLALLDVFESARDDFTDLVRDLPPEQWATPTDLAGWKVHDLVAHTAHLEAVVAGAPEETVPVPDGLAHVVSPMGVYTEQGVIARRDRSPEELLDEIETASVARLAETRAHPPYDGAGSPPKTPGDIGWSWLTLLSNRPLDVYMHEQDVRRAVGRPGHLDTVAARHVVGVFGRGLGFVLGKRAGATPGQSLVVELTDGDQRLGARIGDDGRGAPWRPDGPATVTLRTDVSSFLVLSGGRRPVASVPVSVEGDPDLAARVLAGLAVTP